MHPRTTARRRGTALVAAVAALLLGSCTGSGGPGGPPATASPAPTTAAPSPSGPGPSATPDAQPTAAGTPGPWGAYTGRAEACAAVAEDLVVLALLPANLSADHTVAGVQAVEDDVESVRAAAPPEIAADLARVQLLVDSYGEQLQEDPDARFDSGQLDDALAPVRSWLGTTCRDGG